MEWTEKERERSIEGRKIRRWRGKKEGKRRK